MRTQFLISIIALGLLATNACSGLRPLNIDGLYDTDTDADTDTDTDTDTDADSSDPILTFFSVSESLGEVEVEFKATDDDDDLAGGRFRLTIDGDMTPYDIPDGLDEWDANKGKGTIVITGLGSACGGGSSYDFEGRVVDAAGNSSDKMDDSLIMSGGGTSVPDFGDDPTDAYDVGTLTAGTVLCGSLTTTGNDGQYWTGDHDWVEFRPASSSSMTFNLTWDAADGDYDLVLYNATSLATVDQSTSGGTVQPESITAMVSATSSYLLLAVGWDGSAGGWAITAN